MDRIALRKRVVAGLIWIGLLPYAYCGVAHWCMCGHLAHSRAWYHLLNEFIWVTCYSAVAVLAWRLRSPLRVWIALGAFYLLAVRMVIGGMLLIPEFPAMVALAVLAVREWSTARSRAVEGWPAGAHPRKS